MGGKHFSDEFKADAVRRVVSSGFPVAKVSRQWHGERSAENGRPPSYPSAFEEAGS